MACKNIFAVLDSDDEDVPKIQKVAAPAKETKPQKPTTAATKKPAAKKQVDDKKQNNKPRDNRAPRENREQRPRAPKPQTGDEQTEVVENGERAPREHRERRPRGGRSGPTENRRRDFERRSGTGRGKEASKHGGGAHNWGNENEKAELNAEAEVQEGANVSSDEDAQPAEPVEEEEDKEMSLDQFLAKQKESRTGEHFAEKEIRHVSNEFENAVLITKEGKTPDFIEANYEKVFTKKTSGRKKQIVTDVGFQAPSTNSRRGGRGDGDFRRGGGRRGGRGHSTPNVSDLKEFPSLN